MKVICSSRQSKKTTRLIQESGATGATIVCFNYARCKHVAELAFRMDIDIPTPISYKGKSGLVGNRLKLLIDDVDAILMDLFPYQDIKTIALTGELNE